VTPTTGPAGCSATYKVTSQWQGGFQAEVTVKNTGSSAIGGWKVGWTFPNGQTISQLWNGTLATGGGGAVSVTNLGWNGAVAANATTTFGFLASSSGQNGTPATLSCTAS
jgi:endoglucanase